MTLLVKVSFTLSIVANFQNGDQQIKKIHYARLSWQYINLRARIDFLVVLRPILRIGEYSLVALQYRRIRYIGLRVSANTDTPAAITINSKATKTHGPRRQNVTTNEAVISIHVPPYRLQV